MKKHLRNWGAIWLLLLMFLGSWLGQFLAQLHEIRADAQEHGQAFVWADFWPQFWAATFENWQSEFLQLAIQGLLIASWLAKYTFGADHGADKDDIAELKAEIRALRDERS
jgi:hypothetical protein